MQNKTNKQKIYIWKFLSLSFSVDEETLSLLQIELVPNVHLFLTSIEWRAFINWAPCVRGALIALGRQSEWNRAVCSIRLSGQNGVIRAWLFMGISPFLPPSNILWFASSWRMVLVMVTGGSSGILTCWTLPLDAWCACQLLYNVLIS